MRLLIIVNVDWFFISHRLPIALEAKRRGIEVHIATKITSVSNENLIKKYGIYIHNLSFDRSGKSLWNLYKVFRQIIFLLKKLKPNILHLVTIQPILLGGIAAKMIGIKNIVYAVSGLGHTFLAENISSSIRRFFIIILYRLALTNKNRMVIFQNPQDLTLLSKRCSLSSSEVIVINGSGVDLKKFTFSEVPKSNPTVLMASRLLISKGVYEFIDAAKMINKKGLKIKFQLVGKPDISNPLAIKEDEIKKWVSNGYIEYLGFREDLHQIIPKAHLVVLPSYYPEGLPKIICEAAACGRAVITTDEPGCRDAIENGKTGLLIESKNSKELSEAIIKLIKNRELLKQMSINSRSRAEKYFNIKSIVKKHMNIYGYFDK